jgi:KipI family sensor histidine kinase inhibitor
MTNSSTSFYLMGERAAVLQVDTAFPAHDARNVAKSETASSPSANLECQRRIWRAACSLRQRALCIDIVPGMNNLTAIFDPSLHSGATVLATLKSIWEAAETSEYIGREITIPVQYGGLVGPDLEVVALHNRLEPEDVIRLHTSATYIVYFLGFQPGFAYLGGLPSQLATPRRAEPRLIVPAGSVGIGGSQTGIYPAASPGGWQIIGKTSVALFDPLASSPTLLEPGDIVHFCVGSIDG